MFGPFGAFECIVPDCGRTLLDSSATCFADIGQVKGLRFRCAKHGLRNDGRWGKKQENWRHSEGPSQNNRPHHTMTTKELLSFAVPRRLSGLANGWSNCNELNGLQPQQSKHKTEVVQKVICAYFQQLFTLPKAFGTKG